MTDTPFNEAEQAALHRFLEAINAMLEASPMISGQAIRAFGLVAQQPGLSVDEYASQAGVPNTVMTRHLLDLKDLVWSDRGTHYHPPHAECCSPFASEGAAIIGRRYWQPRNSVDKADAADTPVNQIL
jgi:hypothetical protein